MKHFATSLTGRTESGSLRQGGALPRMGMRTLVKGQAGFTLIELLVVVAIIGLLAGFVAPRYFGQIGKSEVSTAKAQIDALEKALDQFRLDTGHYPSTEIGLNALVLKPQNEPKWNGPYLRKAVPLDPWGKPYIYDPSGPNHNGLKPDISTTNPDGELIGNWQSIRK